MTHLRAAKNTSLMLLALLMPGLSACTVMALRNDVNQHEAIVADKESTLKNAEEEQVRLREESKQLEIDLSTTQVSMNDLQSRLIQLQRLNANTREDTEEKKELKRKRTKQLKNHQVELAKVQQSNTTLAEKQKELESIKKKIADTLKILASS